MILWLPPQYWAFANPAITTVVKCKPGINCSGPGDPKKDPILGLGKALTPFSTLIEPDPKKLVSPKLLKERKMDDVDKSNDIRGSVGSSAKCGGCNDTGNPLDYAGCLLGKQVCESTGVVVDFVPYMIPIVAGIGVLALVVLLRK